MIPQIVFSDMDGTFVATDKSIPPLNWQMLDVLVKKGLYFVPCTGRSFESLPQDLLAHPAVRYVIAANGAYIVDVKEQRRIHSASMGQARALQIYEQVKDKDITFDVFADDSIYAEKGRWERLDTFDVDPHNLKFIKAARKPVDMLVPQILNAFDVIDRITIMWKDPADKELVESLVDADDTLVRVSSGKANIEISDVSATKGKALKWLCDYLGIPVERSVGFGDSLNDLPMIEAAGDGVAMAISADVVAAAADHTTGTNDEGGVGCYVLRALEADSTCD